jgi:trimeric autotransporter adhesin
MQRFLALIALFVFSLPVGLSISGCATSVGNFCNGLGYGPKTNAVFAIDLEPKTTGISLAWGQTQQIGAPSATTCKGASATVSTYTYGTSNLLLADISPTGQLCGGTWNRNSPGGIADFTICTPPTGSSTQACNSTSCGVATVTATGAGVTSNPVNVYIHPPISSITIGANDDNATAACYSQNQPGPVLTQTTTVLGPNGLPIPDGPTSANPNQANYVGTITFTPVTANIVTINNTSTTGNTNVVNGATTANMPGSTVINATVSQSSSGSAAGYFYTCPPRSIAISINGQTNTTVTPSTPLNITASTQDTTGATLNGLTYDFTTTRPQEIAVSTAGQVSATYKGATAITAICQPATCNPAPLDHIGVLGTGMPIVSNTMNVTSVGQGSTLLWMASTQSQYFSQIDLTTGVPTAPIRLPYIPNSMVASQDGNTLYFGSWRELMIYSATNNGLTTEATSVPGVVLAVSPDSTTAVINDQIRQVIYLYSTTTASGSTTPTVSITSIGGQATKAAFSPDNKNVYIVGPGTNGSGGTLYVHNASTGWSTYTNAFTPVASDQACTLNNNSPNDAPTGTEPAYDPFCGSDLTLTIPSVAAFIAGSSNSSAASTVAHSFCVNASVNPSYYPPADIGDAANTPTQRLATTNDGQHIIGATTTGFSDIVLSHTANTALNPYDTGKGVPIGACQGAGGAEPPTQPQTLTTAVNPAPFTGGISPSEIDQVIADPDSSIAFATYSATSATGLLPYYQPSATPGTPGTTNNIQLSGTAQAPVAGIFSPDETIFFVSTTGDNLIHYIDPVGLKDTQTINPGLTNATGQPVPVQMMAIKPRPTT